MAQRIIAGFFGLMLLLVAIAALDRNDFFAAMVAIGAAVGLFLFSARPKRQQ